MFFRTFRIHTATALLFGGLSVGCLGNKNKDVAEPAAPPPAAYPEGPSAVGYADSTTPSTAPAGYGSTVTANQSAPTPPAPAVRSEPFSLRAGEQLIPYQIASGDTLSGIATKFNTSISRIQSANGMSDSKIYAGRTLQVPTSAPPGGVAATSTAPAPTGYGATSSSIAGSYPGTTAAPSPPVVPPASSGIAGNYPSSGTIAPPSVPSASSGTYGSGSYGSSSSPSATSYPPATAAPSPPSPFPTPNLSGSGTR